MHERRRLASASRTRDRGGNQRRDRGEVITEFVILVPVVLLLMFLAIQAAIYFHAANVAQAAAARGAAAASPKTASAGTATQAANEVVRSSGAQGSASAEVGASQAVVRVTVRFPRIVPFFPAAVSRTAREPRERFIPEDER